MITDDTSHQNCKCSQIVATQSYNAVLRVQVPSGTTKTPCPVCVLSCIGFFFYLFLFYNSYIYIYLSMRDSCSPTTTRKVQILQSTISSHLEEVYKNYRERQRDRSGFVFQGRGRDKIDVGRAQDFIPIKKRIN